MVSVLAVSAAAACSSLVDIAPSPYARPQLVDASRSYGQLAAGFLHTCALADGVAWCWGSAAYGQLGAEAAERCEGTPCSRTALRVGADLRFVSIAAGWVHTCGVTADGVAWCWGGGAIDKRGYLGDGALSRSVSPVRVVADSAFSSLTAGDGHTCGLTASGMAFCWGQNVLGQVGDGTREDRPVPVPVATAERFVALSAGANHTCGVTASHEVFCWGDNRQGQLGARSENASDARPGRVSGGVAFMTVASGWEHTCGLAVDGKAFCWGRNDNASQLGDESVGAGRGVPGAVSGQLTFVALHAGALTTCGRTTANELFCWGSNYYGVVGNGASGVPGVDHPVRTDGGPFLSVGIGQAHACALGADRRLWCWGDQTQGQF